jgi:hypothetical protein
MSQFRLRRSAGPMQYTRRLLMGLATYLPGGPRLAVKSTGGTVSARYCYLVWLRHLVLAERSGLSTNPTVVAELGPGDSLTTWSSFSVVARDFLTASSS